LGFTNANSRADLAGPFDTLAANIGAGFAGVGIEYSTGTNIAGRWIGAISFTRLGGGFGASLSKFNTYTQTAPNDRVCVCK
jgi:hypothetical protein